MSGLRWLTVGLVALAFALAAPEWVPHELSREDGPIETATFVCFAVGAVVALVAAARLRPVRRMALGAGVLGSMLFVAAGEEVSWGQRLFGIRTPDAFVDGSRQDELNLHNLDWLQDKAILAQLAVAIGGVLLLHLFRQRWAAPAVPFFVAYLAYRMGRVGAVIADLGVADRNSEASELILAMGLLVLAVQCLRQGTGLDDTGSNRTAPAVRLTGTAPISP